ncbi:uncharacterized [Tachysurus ichikawai]
MLTLRQLTDKQIPSTHLADSSLSLQAPLTLKRLIVNYKLVKHLDFTERPFSNPGNSGVHTTPIPPLQLLQMPQGPVTSCLGEGQSINGICKLGCTANPSPPSSTPISLGP